MSPEPIEKIREYNYNPWAVCLAKDCTWSHPCHRLTRERAKAHAKVKQHHVEITQENAAHWMPKGYDSMKGDKSDEEMQALDLERIKWEWP